MKKDEKWISMARYFAGEMEMKEEIEFRKESGKDLNLQKELNQMEKSWTYLNDQALPEDGSPQSAWDKLNDRLENDGLLDNSHYTFRKRSISNTLRIAASILLMLAIGIPTLWLGVIHNNEKSSSLQHYSKKGISTIDLPDGSRVYLNEGSSFSHPKSFEHGRNVSLDGEAFFEVMSDPANPFTVRSGQVLISVLGTSFNVKKGEHKEEIEVFVKSGKVKMSLENPDEYITLEPGDLGLAESSSLSLREQSDHNYISWKTKDFKFVDEELGEVLHELEESYHVKIRFDGVQLDELRITSTYREQSIDSILETIAAAFNLNVQKKGAIYQLKI